MLPTVVVANLMPGGPASRCNQLNIGDQIIAINGISLVGLPLSSAQTNIKVSAMRTVLFFLIFIIRTVICLLSVDCVAEYKEPDCCEIDGCSHSAGCGGPDKTSRFQVSTRI